MIRTSPLAAAACASVLLGLVIAPGASAMPPAGPEIESCGKYGANQARLRACKAENKANRAAFGQIKDSRFVGVRGDGAAVEDVYCSSGWFEAKLTDSYYGTGTSSGSRWMVADARVRQGGKWIDAFVKSPDGFEIALQRRGAQWKYGIASLGRILEPGNVEKRDASAACADAS